MDWTVWLMFAVTEATLSATPGPAVLFVVSQGLRGGASGALFAALGILAANALYFAISGTGVGALLAGSMGVFTWVKWAGAAYLCYLGAAALLEPRPAEAGRSVTAGAEASTRVLSLRGFVLQLSNPKALLFFVAILPQFIDPQRAIALQIAVLGVTSIGLEFLVLLGYGTAAARAARLAAQPRFAAVTVRIGGVLLLAAALGVARL